MAKKHLWIISGGIALSLADPPDGDTPATCGATLAEQLIATGRIIGE